MQDTSHSAAPETPDIPKKHVPPNAHFVLLFYIVVGVLMRDWSLINRSSDMRVKQSHRHTRFLPGPPAAAWSWTGPARRWGWATDTENDTVRGKGRRRSLHQAHQMSGRYECWRGDSVDSTTAFWWSVACPFWHAAVCGLKDTKMSLSTRCHSCWCVCVSVSPRAAALGLLQEMVSVTMRWDREELAWITVGQWALSFNTPPIICMTSAALHTGLHTHTPLPGIWHFTGF